VKRIVDATLSKNKRPALHKMLTSEKWKDTQF